MSVAFEGIQQDGYRLGDLQAIRYDKHRTDLFSEGYLAKIFQLCRNSRRRSGNGILDTLFGGNPSSDFDSIVSYLAARPVLVILGKWVDGMFVEYGFTFPVISVGRQDTEKAIFAGFAFFIHSWKTDEQRILAMLGLTYLFQELDLQAIHGTAFVENVLPRKFMAQFGMKVVGEVPCYQLQGTKLVPGVVSSLLRSDFEAYVEDWLVKQYRAEGLELAATPEPDSADETVEPAKPTAQPELPLAWL